MPELREVFEMTTKQVEPDVDAWRQQEGRQRRLTRNRRLGAFAVAVAIGVAAIGVILATRSGSNETIPASEPETVIPTAPAAEEVATGFLEAYGAFDVERATTYLASNATLDLFSEDWRFGNRLMEAIGEKVLLDPCAVVNSTTLGTHVRCPFDYHSIRSDEIGRGPFSGSYFDLTVLDGEIVSASMTLEYEHNGFSVQMWEPFGKWVSATYPKDFDAMYTSGGADFRYTDESIRLWKRHTREYVEYVKELTAS